VAVKFSQWVELELLAAAGQARGTLQMPAARNSDDSYQCVLLPKNKKEESSIHYYYYIAV